MSDSSVDRHTCATCGKQYQRSAHLRRHESTRECNGGFQLLFVSQPTLSYFSCKFNFFVHLRRKMCIQSTKITVVSPNFI
ncbi:Putative Zinc finger C2H2-type [Colletotrichum destructivum]|uniref:Zinc finger C2H2-type n=1 Tax=Colletotrichum destructivum TaxID=34406 RepID=A0AAX4I830_9PEZI|nr:Putative Zinc finger C2H2-type [Colletotrichum destructivum]